jgi:ubiquinone/menaquinone biosynthesis C-methylase UbiE
MVEPESTASESAGQEFPPPESRANPGDVPGAAGPMDADTAFDRATVARIYDRIAGQYAERFGDDLRQGTGDRALLDVALGSATVSGPVLDLGCGPGQIAAIAAGSGMRAIGVDLSAGMLAVARRRVPFAAFIAADALALPLTSGSCRAVAAFYCMHHIPRALLPSVLGEVRRVLAVGGTLVIATHLGEGEEWVSTEWNGVLEQAKITFYAMDELAALVRAAGFTVESVASRLPRADEFQAEHGFIRARAI